MKIWSIGLIASTVVRMENKPFTPRPQKLSLSFERGSIVRLKKDPKVWCIAIQEEIILLGEPTRYVRIDSFGNGPDNKISIFGTVIEPNGIFGPIEKYEVEFHSDVIDTTNGNKQL